MADAAARKDLAWDNQRAVSVGRHTESFPPSAPGQAGPRAPRGGSRATEQDPLGPRCLNVTLSLAGPAHIGGSAPGLAHPTAGILPHRPSLYPWGDLEGPPAGPTARPLRPPGLQEAVLEGSTEGAARAAKRVQGSCAGSVPMPLPPTPRAPSLVTCPLAPIPQPLDIGGGFEMQFL